MQTGGLKISIKNNNKKVYWESYYKELWSVITNDEINDTLSLRGV